MKVFSRPLLLATFSIVSLHMSAQPEATSKPAQSRNLFLDVHQLEPGKVKFTEVAKAHARDLATQGKYNAQFLKYWVDEKNGTVFCLVSATDTQSIRKTHAEAHGLMPNRIYPVTSGVEAAMSGKTNLYMDIHHIGAGKVTSKDVAAAHEKDLEVQKKHGVNLITYWLDEKEGVVVCLAEAIDSSRLVKTHQEAHGLLPDRIFKVKQGE